ncbi:hypothetical protein E3C22_24300 [Jiella endophytica]|uniref:Uncharacterized protein n=1 Tax=Jiella endophytica TaxID=2558362 RepID=A0A4Y8R6E9_9HYPH|nr:hypothetical protein [Jiella endophytica]TFF17191.1 hypothetical protein E3C22_24300 [Jiella endophytica]
MMTDELSALKADIDASLVVESVPPEIAPSTASVVVQLSPRSIPYNALQHVDLITLFLSQYRSSFSRSSLIAPEMELATVINRLISAEQPLIFEGGHYEHTEGETISIRSLRIMPQHISAEVFGTTREALFIVKKTLELLWSSVGRERRWGEIMGDMGIVTYNTSTKVRLGVNLLDLLSDEFRKFLNETVSGRFTKKMGTLGQISEEIGSELIAIPHCREINIEISMFDRTTGKQEDMTLNLIPSTNFTRNTDDVLVLSELPFEVHVELVTELIAALSKSH